MCESRIKKKKKTVRVIVIIHQQSEIGVRYQESDLREGTDLILLQH